MPHIQQSHQRWPDCSSSISLLLANFWMDCDILWPNAGKAYSNKWSEKSWGPSKVTEVDWAFFANSCRVCTCLHLWRFSRFCFNWYLSKASQLRCSLQLQERYLLAKCQCQQMWMWSCKAVPSVLRILLSWTILSTVSPKHSDSDVSSSLVAQSFARCLLAGCAPITGKASMVTFSQIVSVSPLQP